MILAPSNRTILYIQSLVVGNLFDNFTYHMKTLKKTYAKEPYKKSAWTLRGEASC